MKEIDTRKLSPEQQKIIRIKAVDMVFLQEIGRRQVAKLLGVSRNHVGKWCRAYEEGGYPALAQGRRGRRPQEQLKLKPHQCASIVRMITDKTPDQLKMPFVLWTRAAVRDLISQRFGVMLAVRTVGDYLARWGMTPQKPIEKAYQQNPAAVTKWLEETYPTIKAKAKKEGGVILWADETGIQNTDNCGRSYSPIGKTPIRKQDGKRMRINMISAISNRGDIRFMVYSGKMNQAQLISFLKRLIQGFGEKIFLILDNLKVHHGKKVAAWVKEHSDSIELHFIPAYSPELNPDEYLNRDLKKNVHAKRIPRTPQELKANVISFMRMLQKKPSRVKMYFHSRYIDYAADAA